MTRAYILGHIHSVHCNVELHKIKQKSHQGPNRTVSLMGTAIFSGETQASRLKWGLLKGKKMSLWEHILSFKSRTSLKVGLVCSKSNTKKVTKIVSLGRNGTKVISLRYTVDTCYLEVHGTFINTLRYP